MRVLVTGGAGFIGSHLVDAFVRLGHQVSVVDDLSTGSLEHLNPYVTFYELDVRDPALAEVFERERPEVVSHHAAHVDVRRSTEDAVFDAEVNVLGTVRVLHESARSGVGRFIFSSSGGAVYGEPERLPVDETHPPRPISPYGASKRAAEEYVELFGAMHGLAWTVLRYANVYGPRQGDLSEAGVVSIFARRMLDGRPCVINGDGDQQRDFVFVGDCVRVSELILDGAGAGRTYNIGTGVPASVNDVFESLARRTGYTLAPVHGPAQPGETYRIYLDASKARDELGWEPRVGLEDGLAITVADLER
jgi:UDP-glucose 4-epimerase